MALINQNIINLVVARLSTMPPTMKIYVGGEGSFNKDELIKHVELRDSIGKLIIDMHVNYIRSLVNQ